MKFFPVATLLLGIARPFFLLFTVALGGAGRGSYLLAKLLFPWTMAATAFTREIAQPFIALAIVQYPVYGIVLDWARCTARLKQGLLTLAGVHVAAVMLALGISHPSFTP